uniref:Uncharacterized protein n=1 Tax=Anguilla anguilla TaxID=7936 RepID=A0A0E9S700_ANGAN
MAKNVAIDFTLCGPCQKGLFKGASNKIAVLLNLSANSYSSFLGIVAGLWTGVWLS